jgi:hypothetical protein
VGFVDLGRSFETGPAPALTQPNEAAYHQWFVGECGRYLGETIQFLVILIETAREPGTDEVFLSHVERPPAALEIQKGTLAFGELNQICHSHSLPV